MSILQRRLVRVAAAAVAVVGWGAVLGAPTGASAAIIVTTPPSLSPGDQYRLGFVTKDTGSALFSDIAVYNTFVTQRANSQAELAALGATWKAIASTSTVDAKINTDTDNTTAIGFPIFLLNGMKLVDSNSDLWDGSIDIPFSVFEDGTPVPAFTGVWTGTLFFGLDATGSELGFVSIGMGNATQGAIPATNESWVDFSFIPKIDESGVVKRHFYALSSVLTIPAPPVRPPGVAAVPLPGALILFGSGLACLAFLRRRNRSVRPA